MHAISAYRVKLAPPLAENLRLSVSTSAGSARSAAEPEGQRIPVLQVPLWDFSPRFLRVSALEIFSGGMPMLPALRERSESRARSREVRAPDRSVES
jgi:hypothetical protein